LTAPTLVIGGTRRTGLIVVRTLIARGAGVRVLARRPEEARRAIGEGAEIVSGDVVDPASLAAAVAGTGDVIYTAGVSGLRAVRRSRDVVVRGVGNVLAAGVAGRFVFLSSIGVTSHSPMRIAVDAIRGGAMTHKAEAERIVRASGVPYAIVRAGVLTDDPPGTRPVRVSQGDVALTPRRRIARADVAAILLAAAEHPAARNVTFEVVWSRAGTWPVDLGRLTAD
jgi:uncharacterized protein YbjT (DUF2867 family)